MPRANVNIELASRLYADGWSLIRISQSLGHNAGTVRRALADAGVEIRSRGGILNKRRSPLLPYDAEIIRLYQSGKTMREISEQLHWSVTSIRYCLVRNNIKIRRRGIQNNHKVSHEEYQRTIELYRSGLSAKEVGKILGLTATGVYGRLKYCGEPRRSDADKTHCPQGHEYNEENVRMDHRGARVCRTCNSEKQREYRRKRSERNQVAQAQEAISQAA